MSKGSCSFLSMFAPWRSVSARATAWDYWTKTRNPNTPFQASTQGLERARHTSTQIKGRRAHTAQGRWTGASRLNKAAAQTLNETERPGRRWFCHFASVKPAKRQSCSLLLREMEHIRGATRRLRKRSKVQERWKVF